MKTLYININNEQIQSNEELEVLNYDLDSDFFFYLGEKIAKGCKVENENALITDFNTQDNEEDYKQIIAQWNELKNILFSEECEGEFKFVLPDGYIHWLRYSEKYNHVHDKNFSHGESPVISIDLEELYEESVEDMQRKVLRTLKRNDLYLGVDEIVFNDDAVTRKSSIIRTIKDKYEGVGFKTYKKWLQDNDEKPHTTPQICEKCEKNPCECYFDEQCCYAVAVNLNKEPSWSSVERKYKFYNHNGQPLDDNEYYVVAENEWSNYHIKTNLLVIRTAGDSTLYYICPNGDFYKIGEYDYETGQRVGISNNKDYWKYQAFIIQNKYILYRNGFDHTLYEICANNSPRLLSKFQSKINFANSSYSYICRDLLTNGEYTINWKTGELINIPNSRFSIILGYNNDSPIYLIPPKRWNPETDYYKNGSVVDSEGNFLWKFNADTFQVLSNNLLLLDSGKNQVKNLDGKTIINTNDSIDEVKICGYDCLIFDEKIYVISKNKLVNYLYEKVYIIVSNNKANVYDNQTDELISAFCLKGVYSYDGDGGEEYLDMDSDIYIIPFEEWGEQGDIYSISQCKKIYTTIGNERFIGAKNDKFIVEGETYFEIYDNKGTLLRTLEKGDDPVVTPVLHNNGYISWFNVNQNRIEYYDTFLNPYYISEHSEINYGSGVSVLSKDCVIINAEHETFVFRHGECIYRGFRLDKLDENNFYGADYHFEDKENNWCVVNVTNGTIPVHGKCGEVYLIK